MARGRVTGLGPGVELGRTPRRPASWSTTSGTHTLTVRGAFTHLPDDKPQVVGAQIHDASDAVTVFRLEANCTNSSPCDDSNYGEVTVYDVTVSHT